MKKRRLIICRDCCKARRKWHVKNGICGFCRFPLIDLSSFGV